MSYRASIALSSMTLCAVVWGCGDSNGGAQSTGDDAGASADANPIADANAGSDAESHDAATHDAASDAASGDANIDVDACTPNQVTVCGRGSLGIACATSGGSDDGGVPAFGALTTLQADFADSDASDGFDSDPSYYGTIQFPDVDGDGHADVCGRGPNGIVCALWRGNSFGPTSIWQADYSDGLLWGTSDTYWATIRFPDIDGDGKADVCGRSPAGIQCAISDGSKFGGSSIWSTSLSDSESWGSDKYALTIDFPDVDGDGKADLCGRGADGIRCALSNGSAFGSFDTWQGDYSDGAGWGADPKYYATIRFPDIDGNGKADVCGRWTNGIVCALSTGTAFSGQYVALTEFGDREGWDSSPSLWSTIEFPDISGDGQADVCARGPTGVICGVSSEGFFEVSNIAGDEFSDANGWGQAARYGTLQFPDVDGDGKADVCGRRDDGIVCALSIGNAFGDASLVQADFTSAGWSDESRWATIQFPKPFTRGCGPSFRAAPARPVIQRSGDVMP